MASFDVDVTVSDISISSTSKPMQPRLSFYPNKYISGRSRSFLPTWYDKYSWLEYSISRNVAFCFCCRHFGGPTNSWTTTGFDNWKDGPSSHGETVRHKTAFARWKDFLKTIEKDRGSIQTQLDTGRRQLVATNRDWLNVVIDVLRWTAVQRISQRGHDESETSENKGNFLELLNFVEVQSENVSNLLKSRPANALYTSPRIQNEILTIMAMLVRIQIKVEITQVKYWSLIVDETKDLSKHEQLSICVRYWLEDGESSRVTEEFLTFNRCEDMTAETMFKNVTSLLDDIGIDLKTCVSQVYDGASVMSGHLRGLQARIRAVAPNAIYIHCFAHRLNLVLVDCCKKFGSRFFELIQRLYIFMSGSHCAAVLEKAQKEYPSHQRLTLKALSDTRWSAQSSALTTMKVILSAVVDCLGTLSEETESSAIKRALDAEALLGSLDFKFVMELCIYEKILKITHILSKSLQAETLNLASAIELVRGTEESLIQLKRPQEYHSLWIEIVELREQIFHVEEELL